MKNLKEILTGSALMLFVPASMAAVPAFVTEALETAVEDVAMLGALSLTIFVAIVAFFYMRMVVRSF